MSAGLVIGVAGAGLTDGSFAVDAGTARVGADGERKTAAILDPFTQTASVTVLHDLMVSARGYRSNIDHVVVSGRHVLIVDSKVWLPGFYWTVNGATRRGMARFTPADSHAVDMVADMLTDHLKARRIDATLDTPVIAVWPSRKAAAVRTWAYRPPRGRAVPGRKLSSVVARFATHGPADERIITALTPLATRPKSVRRVSG